MRQSLRRQKLHRGFPMPRLLTMCLMLAILGMIFTRMRDPSTWRLFAADVDDRLVVADTLAPVIAAKNIATTKTQDAAPAKPAASGSVSVAPHDTAASDTKSAGTDVKPSLSAVISGTSSEAESGYAAPVQPASAPAEPKSSAAPPALAPTGPTDLDEDEREEIKPSLSVLSDGSFATKPEEGPAYLRILKWVDNQPLELLHKRAIPDFLYDTLVRSPNTMRLAIVEVRLNVRQIVRIMGKPENGQPKPMLSPEGKQLYEVRGFSQESGSNLFFAVVSDLPPDMPVGTFINEEAKLIGYFFKVQGYESQTQQLEAEEHRHKMTPLKAPLIIGRLIWQPHPDLNMGGTTPVWVLAPVGGVGIIGIIGWVYWSSRRKRIVPRITMVGHADPDGPSVDNWLDQAQSGTIDYEPDAGSGVAGPDRSFGGRFSGNIFDDLSESKDGAVENLKNGHSNNGHGKNGHSGPEPEVRENDSPSN